MIKTAARILAEIRRSGGEVEPVKRPVGRPRLDLKCSIDWCDDRHKGLGYCNRHHYSYTVYGDPLATQRVFSPPERTEAHMWPWCTKRSWRAK